MQYTVSYKEQFIAGVITIATNGSLCEISWEVLISTGKERL
ncbi:hypothetical protein HMPREF9969_0803 [Prevotella sp. oral taxon 306 str. F0472]|nr:hypothetical protein HMPREF9969_0803 [Prevotella sp. oral taxon 306 str. F0472]